MDDQIDLRHLRYFLAVAEEGTFRGAAERLFVSQPPLSRQIRQLERALGVILFQRARSGVTLTRAGTALMPAARRALAQAERAVAVARTAGGAHDELVVGYTIAFDHSAFPDILSAFRRRHPYGRVVVKRKTSVGLVRDLERGNLDVAFISSHVDAPGLTVEVLREEPFVVALTARHRLARKRRVGLDDLGRERLFWFERRQNPGLYDYCRARFAQAGFNTTVTPEPPDHHILLGLIAEGAGIALLPASLRNVKRKGVVFRSLKRHHRLSTGIALAYSEGSRSPLLRAFIDAARLRTRGGARLENLHLVERTAWRLPPQGNQGVRERRQQGTLITRRATNARRVGERDAC